MIVKSLVQWTSVRLEGLLALALLTHYALKDVVQSVAAGRAHHVAPTQSWPPSPKFTSESDLPQYVVEARISRVTGKLLPQREIQVLVLFCIEMHRTPNLHPAVLNLTHSDGCQYSHVDPFLHCPILWLIHAGLLFFPRAVLCSCSITFCISSRSTELRR